MPPPRPRRTVRARLTLLYGALFLASGGALLAVTYLLVLHAVEVPVAPPAPPRPGDLFPPATATAPESFSVAIGEIVKRQNSVLLDQLLTQSGIALAIMAVLSVVAGWFVAGRVLSRLRTVTTAARTISATDLHRRLALDGPDDELKELGDTFDGLLARLEASFAAQRRFVANASHELRTPLARQRTLGQVALADPGATVESLREAHERILAAGAQQERLLEALLTLARGHAGIEVRRPFDLAELAREVVDARRPEIAQRGVTAGSVLSPAIVTGHRPLAERLVANLADNAIRYNVPDGRVDVVTRTVDGRAVLTVANTGPVVPPASIGRLFQPFQRLGTARTGHGDGLGLGLSIVEAVATAHDAVVTAEANPHGGLVVTVVFPPPVVIQGPQDGDPRRR